MHSRQLVQLAGWAAAHAPELIYSKDGLPESALQRYWVASKCRMHRWTETLRRFSCRPSPGNEPAETLDPKETRPDRGPSRRLRSGWKLIQSQRRFLACLEEILLSELLTRVWTALLTAYDQQHAGYQAGPLARSILQDHVELRSRVLYLLLQPDEHLASEASRLNRLRSQVERWTDLLLAALADLVQPTPFAFEPSRVQDFAGDFSRQRPPAQRRQAWQLTLWSLREAFKTGLQPISPNPDLNQTIAQAVLECLPKELSLWNLEQEWLWYLQVDQYTWQLENLLQDLLAEAGNS